MDWFELIAVAVGLSMDAFAVAVCKGLAVGKAGIKYYVIIGLWFGGFQALMPLIGYLLGSLFVGYIAAVDHWISFGLLALIGANMIREAFSKKEEEADSSLGFFAMLMLAVATSIDALAVGVTFSFDMGRAFIVPAVLIIGVITFIISVVGVKVGSVFGAKYKSKAEFVGGVILILIGIKVLLTDLGVF